MTITYTLQSVGVHVQYFINMLVVAMPGNVTGDSTFSHHPNRLTHTPLLYQHVCSATATFKPTLSLNLQATGLAI